MTRRNVRLARWAMTPIVLGIASMIFQACHPEPPIDPRIWRWMTCIECIDREQADVVAMGPSAIPALRYLLIEGPPDTTIARKTDALNAPYREDAANATMVAPPASYVASRIDDFAARYRVRSSLALGLIGTDSARRALCTARLMQLRPDVRRFVDSGLVLLNGACP